MNYEQKYKEALEKARKKIENSRNIEMVSFIEDAFSELKDSKDEKIKKELIKWMKDFPDEIWRFIYKKILSPGLKNMMKIHSLKKLNEGKQYC